MKGTLDEDKYIFSIISRSFLLRMKNISNTNCGQNKNTLFMFSKVFENRAAYEIMWKNIVESDGL